MMYYSSLPTKLLNTSRFVSYTNNTVLIRFSQCVQPVNKSQILISCQLLFNCRNQLVFYKTTRIVKWSKFIYFSCTICYIKITATKLVLWFNAVLNILTQKNRHKRFLVTEIKMLYLLLPTKKLLILFHLLLLFSISILAQIYLALKWKLQ